jgi:uracil-DNA glycosylase
MSDDIIAYQQRCWKEYKTKLGLSNYNYLYGNPVKVHVPVDVATGGLMIVGAYPTAQFNSIMGPHGIIMDVPVADHLFPFSNDTYFDGSRTRQVKSGEEIEEFFLKKLNYHRSKCWITDLVKVFLFKEGHINKYHELQFTQCKETRSEFSTLAKASLSFLYEEIELAKPKIILLLGEEVTSVVLQKNRCEANNILKEGIQQLELKGVKYNVIASPHPGIMMRGGEAAEKWRKISEIQLEKIKDYLI